jgi:hypothetical protein
MYTPEERKVQYEETMKLYHLNERLAWIYEVFSATEKQAKALSTQTKGKVKVALEKLAEKAGKSKDGLVFMGGDGYVNEDEALREELSDVYRQVSTFPGKPTRTQLDLSSKMEKTIAAVEARMESMLSTDIAAVNTQLSKQKLSTINNPSLEEFLKAETKTGDAASGFKMEALHLWKLH